MMLDTNSKCLVSNSVGAFLKVLIASCGVGVMFFGVGAFLRC